MQISKNVVNEPKRNWVFVGIQITVCIKKTSHHFLQAFRPLCVFKHVFPDSSLDETIVFILSAMTDQSML